MKLLQHGPVRIGFTCQGEAKEESSRLPVAGGRACRHVLRPASHCPRHMHPSERHLGRILGLAPGIRLLRSSCRRRQMLDPVCYQTTTSGMPGNQQVVPCEFPCLRCHSGPTCLSSYKCLLPFIQCPFSAVRLFKATLAVRNLHGWSPGWQIF